MTPFARESTYIFFSWGICTKITCKEITISLISFNGEASHHDDLDFAFAQYHAFFKSVATDNGATKVPLNYLKHSLIAMSALYSSTCIILSHWTKTDNDVFGTFYATTKPWWTLVIQCTSSDIELPPAGHGRNAETRKFSLGSLYVWKKKRILGSHI